MVHSWSVTCFLQVHFKINKIDYDLCLSLRLHIAAHYPEAYQWFSVFGNKSGDNCMKRPFTRSISICMTLSQTEHLTPVLQNKTQAGRTHTGPHSSVVTLY